MSQTTCSRNVGALALAAIGIVFGDIGTSPLYAMKETFAGPHPLPVDRPHVLGVLSLVFWAITIVVSLKYVVVMMRADNRGEGGSLALLALLGRAAQDRPRLSTLIGVLGIFAAALFYGDSMITPAISVLSAVEGLEVAAPRFSHVVEPLTLAVLAGLFLIQRHGSGAVGALFGPVMLVWFVTLAVLGVRNIALAPSVLTALSPHFAVMFLFENGLTGFLALGSVVLVVTGAEALYADMGHFGRLPIRLAWYLVALPSLLLNYFGQGALLLTKPGAVENPFILLAPAWAGLPLVLLSTAATVIASQAVISGAFSVSRQAIQLGYLPRLTTLHTSEKEIGQIYIPFINWMLALTVMALVLGFQSSSNLAAAYGVAVTGTMIISTILLAMVMSLLWGWKGRRTGILVGMFLAVDGGFFLTNISKIPHGGWFPLAVALVIFAVLMTWKTGRTALFKSLRRDSLSVEEFLASLSERVTRVPGTAIFLHGTRDGVPLALLHNLKHNKVLHERVVILNVLMEETPFVAAEQRIESENFGQGMQRLRLRFGFMEDPNIPRTLALATQEQLGFFYEPMTISYFLSRETLIPSESPSLPAWQNHLFIWLARNAAGAMDFFHLPHNRVVELGAQVKL